MTFRMLRWLRFRMLRWLSLTLFVVLLVPAVAWASTASSAPTLILPWQQIWPIIIGALVPLATYVLNHVGPWVSEPVKAAVLVVVAAITTALYTALATNVIGLNDSTLQLVLTGVGSALAAHKLLWQPSGISSMLGGGSNRVVKQIAGTLMPAGSHVAPLLTVPVAPQALPKGAPPPPATGARPAADTSASAVASGAPPPPPTGV